MLMEGEIIDFNQDSFFILCSGFAKSKKERDKEKTNGEVLVGMVIL